MAGAPDEKAVAPIRCGGTVKNGRRSRAEGRKEGRKDERTDGQVAEGVVMREIREFFDDASRGKSSVLIRRCREIREFLCLPIDRSIDRTNERTNELPTQRMFTLLLYFLFSRTSRNDSDSEKCR